MRSAEKNFTKNGRRVAILMAQGVDARSISELLGHSSVAFTLQVYGHLMEETKRDTANKMDAAPAPRKPAASPSLGREANEQNGSN